MTNSDWSDKKEQNPFAPQTAVVFDRQQVRLHRDRAAPIFENHDFLFREVADRLCDKLLDVNRSFSRILDLGCHRGELGAHLLKDQPELLIRQDLSRKMLDYTGGTNVQADEEFLPYRAESLDLVMSNLSLHWVNDLPGSLIQIRNTLKPDGLFLGAMFGGETLTELRQSLMQAEINMDKGTAPHVSPFVDVRDAGSLLQRAGFALPVVDTDRITVTYKDALSLMTELRGMGEGNALAKKFRGFSSREMIMETARVYHDLFADDRGRIKVTFDILYLMGWAPHESQQKPLKPGSAKMRLADALGVREQSTGEKPGS